MRIAQISPLFESVPPRFYGGTERIVADLTKSLVALGQDVTVFASRDSDIPDGAHFVPAEHKALRLAGCKDPIPPHYLMFEQVRRLQDHFDIIHFHNEYLHFPVARTLETPTVSTLHGRLDLRDYPELFGEFSDLPLVSISFSQRKPLPHAHWAGMVHHGLDSSHLPFYEKGKGYLAFLGRLTPEKGFERAVEIARHTGRRLKVAAKIEPDLYPEYVQQIAPLLNEPFVEYIGEIDDSKKAEFLGSADATLFPIQWPEPFGLVLIESLACGTPIVAFRRGSVPEIIKPGVTGFIVENVEEACQAIESVDKIDRRDCRRDFETRFSLDRMAKDYLKIYQSICKHAPVHKIRPKVLSEHRNGPA
jgi:glycosyltransferase involved in cell wall biosynthesis